MSVLKEIAFLVVRLVVGVLGWVLIVPIALFIPKRRDWVGVFGRQDGRFLDNAKYFFLQAADFSNKIRVVFISENEEVCINIKSFDREALHYPSIESIWFLLRCGSFVVDEASWYKKLRFYFLYKAKIVQLWHGVPFKFVELGLWKNQLGGLSWISSAWVLGVRLGVYKITGRRMRYAVFAATSEFYKENSFAPSFKAEYFPVIGYPRNDFALSLKSKSLALAWSNVDLSISSMLHGWMHDNKKLVLVAPTFRDSGAAPMLLDAEMLLKLDRFAEKNSVEFVFKFHPSEKNTDSISGRHFHVCSRDSDIYPILPYASALVTDYSSISMDFLLVDKPLFFLIPPNDNYVEKDRQLQFDPRTMMPGPVVSDWSSLMNMLLSEWTNDNYIMDRAVLCRKAFDSLPQAEAVPKLLALMSEQGWITKAAPRDRS